MKICVVGGAGFIGHHIVKKFLTLGHEVSVIDDLSTGKEKNIPKECKKMFCDISTTDVEVITEWFKGVDIVYHLAAKARVQPSIIDPIIFNKINVDGTLNILFAAHKANVKRLVFSSSSSVYGNSTKLPTDEDTEINPISPYALQKYIGEMYCKLFSQIYNLDTVSLRYFNVYGEGMLDEGAYCTVIGIFGNQFKNKKSLTITNDGEQRRDFTYVKDVVEANYLVGVHSEPFNGDVFNVGNNENYSVNDIAKLFDVEKIYGEKRIEPKETLANIDKIKNRLGWRPTGNVIDWVIQYRNKINE